MRVLHVISDENIGGAGVLLTSLLRNFDRSSIESVVALPQNSALTARIGSDAGRIIPLLHRVDRVSPRAVRELKKLIEAVSPDIIHTNAALSARIAARLCHIPILHTRHCTFPIGGMLRFPPIRILSGVGNRMLSDKVIATSESAKENLIVLGMHPNRIHVIINGSEPIRELTSEEKEHAYRRWGISSTDFTVGICARLVRCKGHRTFLRAARLLCDVAPLLPFRFLIVGEGEERAALEKQVRDLRLTDRVIFTGFVEDMASIYRILRVNVNCSTGTETSCLALSEGMSAGVPCVASDFGGNPDMIGDSLAGFVYPANDSVMLAKLILKIATDGELETRMRRAAYERYLEKYTAHAMAEAVFALYRSIIDEKNKQKSFP